MSLLPQFNPKAVMFASAAAMAVVPNAAQAADVREILTTAAEVVNTATDKTGNSTTTTLDTSSCMETTVETRKRNGFLGIIGGGRSSKTSTSYNADCNVSRVADAITQMSTMSGEPDYNMQSLVIHIYREANPDVKRIMDQMLAERGTDIATLTFNIDRRNAAVQCVRQSAPASALQGTVAVRVTFNCKNRVAPAPAAALTNTGVTADTAATSQNSPVEEKPANPAAETQGAAAQPAAPQPAPPKA